MAFDKKLIKHVEDLNDELKEAKSNLNKALVETDLYKKFLAFVLEENIAEKPAKAQALKLTYEFFRAQV
jgi:predicted transport protein